MHKDIRFSIEISKTTTTLMKLYSGPQPNINLDMFIICKFEKIENGHRCVEEYIPYILLYKVQAFLSVAKDIANP